MSLEPGTVATIIVTLSVAGFTIIIAIPTISSTFYELLTDKDEDEAKFLQLEPAYRLIERFRQPKWFLFFAFLSIVFIVPGVLIVVDALFGWDTQVYGLWLLLVGMILFVGGTFFAFLRSTILLPSELRKTISYLESGLRKVKNTKPKRKRCPYCGALNDLDSRFCKKCAKEFKR